MSVKSETDVLAHAVFAGLKPTSRVDEDRPVRQDTGRLPRGVLATGSLVLAGAMTVSMNLTAPIDSEAAHDKRSKSPQLESGPLNHAVIAAASSQPAPASYTV